MDLRDAHLSKKEDIWNGEKRDDVDQDIVSDSHVVSEINQIRRFDDKSEAVLSI